MTVFRLDAHTDTREECWGSNHNHACTMNWAASGVRSFKSGFGSSTDPRCPASIRIGCFYAHQICGPDGSIDWIDRVIDLLTGKVYLTIDVDSFDFSIARHRHPGTRRPRLVPGDALLERVAKHREVVRFDVVELLPTPGQWASDFSSQN